MTTRPLGAHLSHMLKDRGVEVIFGIPGVHNIELYRGIEEAGLQHVLARHEQGAAFMADGYARATGRPGVCYLITGPGVLNALTALGQAYSDSVPVLALASCLDEVAAARGQLHQMRDQRGAAATVCDWSHEPRTAQAAYALVDQALSEFQISRPRPKALHLPISLLGQDAPAPGPRPGVPTRPHVAPEQVRDAAKQICAAQKPLFVFGGGARGASDAAQTVLRHARAASFTTYAGRGVVDADNALHFGAYLARPDSARIAASADLVVAVGTELAETDLWRRDLGHDAPMIRVDLDPSVLATAQAGDTALLGCAGDFLRALATVLDTQPAAASQWHASDVAACKARWRAEVTAERPNIVETTDALRAVMPKDAMIWSDMTQFAYAAKEVWDMPRAGHWHHPTGFGTLGYALPAAIGGAVARRGLPTVAILGDYGLQYTLPELGTAVELGLSLPILVWDNAALAEIRDAMTGAQIAPNAVHAQNPDFIALAKAYGARATQPTDLNALQTALTEAFAAPVPTLIRMTPDML